MQGGQGFQCPSCGAALTWNAAARAMTCEHCGTKQAVAVDPGANIRSILIEEGIRQAQRGLGAPVQTIGCKDCGATVNIGEGERTTKCAFCGSQQVLAQATDPNSIRPESLVPFGITKQVANERFGALAEVVVVPADRSRRGWARSKRWEESTSPTGRSIRHVHSVLESAERGWYYYETEAVRGDRRERQAAQTKTRQVQKTRWEPAYRQPRWIGYVRRPRLRRQGPPRGHSPRSFVSFDVAKLVPYQPGFPRGLEGRVLCTLDLMPGWQPWAKHHRDGVRSSAARQGHRRRYVARTLAVANGLRPGRVQARAVCQFGSQRTATTGRSIRFLVNGQTGEIVGERSVLRPEDCRSPCSSFSPSSAESSRVRRRTALPQKSRRHRRRLLHRTQAPNAATTGAPTAQH